jgi:hypothetical protein
MKTRLLLVLGVLVLGCGCSVGDPSQYPSALPTTVWEQRDCEVWGGYWNRTALICEWKE